MRKILREIFRRLRDSVAEARGRPDEQRKIRRLKRLREGKNEMRREYHEQAVFAILEEMRKPRKYRQFSDETLEELLKQELEFLKEHEKERREIGRLNS
jgi:hypothetical protein